MNKSFLLQITAATALAVSALTTQAQTPVAPQAPQYGGSLTVSPYQFGLSALSWDPADWNWKVNVDAGPYMEQLMVGDLSKGIRGGGTYRFSSEAYVPPSVLRGELIESWKLNEKPLSIEMKLRQGVMWQAREGVMAEREFIAEDVVYAFNRQIKSPKAVKDHFEFIDRVETKDKHTVIFYLNKYNAEWEVRLGYGFYFALMPKEVAEAPNGGGTNWRNASGTGPFKITDFVQGSHGTYTKNQGYWDSERIAGKSYKLPFVNTLTIRTIRDQQTRMAAFRTGKIDVLLNASWKDVEQIKSIMPNLKFRENPHFGGTALALRTDMKPFDDIRVRRAMNMAVDKQAILKSFYGGAAALVHMPMSSGWTDYYTPVDKMPPAVRELYEFNPAKAKELLAQAGHPNGFEFKMQIATNVPESVEVAQLVAAYLARIGVKMTIETLEYGAYMSIMTTSKHGPGYWHQVGLSNPTMSLDKLFSSDSAWNTPRLKDPKIDQALEQIMAERDEAKRIPLVKALNQYAMEQAPFIFLPVPNSFVVWWPWVKNYEGEQAVGAQRNAPIWARVWIDEALKKQMGF